MSNLISGIVTNTKTSVTKQGLNYLVLTINDGKTKHSVSVWNCKPQDIRVGWGLNVKVKDADGFLSATLKDIEFFQPSEQLQKLLPKCITREVWDKTISQNLLIISKKYPVDSKEYNFYKNLASKLYPLYSEATAAKSNHHNFIGGLAQHTYELLNIFNGLFGVLPYDVDPFVVLTASIMHDFGKLSEYTKDFEYQDSFFLQGHPFLSAEAIGQFLRKGDFSPHVIKHIQHCVLAHHKKLEFGSPVVPATIEAFIVAELDEMSGIGVQFLADPGTKTMGTMIQKFDNIV